LIARRKEAFSAACYCSKFICVENKVHNQALNLEIVNRVEFFSGKSLLIKKNNNSLKQVFLILGLRGKYKSDQNCLLGPIKHTKDISF
jgi:hypothetical protein